MEGNFIFLYVSKPFRSRYSFSTVQMDTAGVTLTYPTSTPLVSFRQKIDIATTQQCRLQAPTVRKYLST